MHRLTLVAVLALGSLLPAAEADVGIGVHVRVAPGVYIGANWRARPRWVAVAPLPNLAIVDVNIRPKHTRLYLDGRFIGTADDFDGYPDFLYLQPGRYRLECRLGGFRDEVVEINAAAGYRHDVRFHMTRLAGVKKEHWWQGPDLPRPVQRVYAPVVAQPLGAPSAAAGPAGPGAEAAPAPPGADVRLRPDLGGSATGDRPRPEQPAAAAATATLELQVAPAEASVYLDGAFLATARELSGLSGPLAISTGKHVLEAMAPGFAPEKREIVAIAGKTLRLQISLLPSGG